MSFVIAKTLFPDLSSLAETYTPLIWSLIFPPSQEHKCPKEQALQFTIPWPLATKYNHAAKTILKFVPSWLPTPTWYENDATILIYSPALLILTVVGVGVGLQGYMYVKPVLWRRVFLLYAGMNAGAVVCHCLAPRQGSFERWFGWVVDVACTGSLAINMMLAALYSPGPEKIGKKKGGKNLPRRVNILSQLVCILYAILAFCGIRTPDFSNTDNNSNNTTSAAFVSEILYLGSVSVASAVVFTRLWIPGVFFGGDYAARSWKVNYLGRCALVAAAVFISGGAALGPVMDSWICEWVALTGNSGTLLGQITFMDPFFLGCLLGMQAFMVYILFGYGSKKRIKKE
ncbi:hypothetical protein HK100_003742 [Physocladia obscura]|uniref:Uncharacterized protein n=1 Tax=Physocladia obscura TaxID=109957 RepID=A0AAD5T7E1_9FUNG|nr:hypothetical protein HK100_003742 [Physocladia obscura]